MVFSKLIVFLVLLNFLNSQMVTCYLCLYDMISVIIPDSSVFALNFPRSLQALMLLSCFFFTPDGESQLRKCIHLPSTQAQGSFPFIVDLIVNYILA